MFVISSAIFNTVLKLVFSYEDYPKFRMQLKFCIAICFLNSCLLKSFMSPLLFLGVIISFRGCITFKADLLRWVGKLFEVRRHFVIGMTKHVYEKVYPKFIRSIQASFSANQNKITAFCLINSCRIQIEKFSIVGQCWSFSHKTSRAANRMYRKPRSKFF